MQLTFEKINALNAHFWACIEEKLNDTITNQPSVFQEVRDQMTADYYRHPLYSRRPMEKVLIDVETQRKLHQKEFSTLGGKAKKPDGLNELVQIIVRKRPHISCNQLWDELNRSDKTWPFLSIENNEIVLASGKIVPRSGLKDRLSRAKRKIEDSRNRATG